MFYYTLRTVEKVSNHVNMLSFLPGDLKRASYTFVRMLLKAETGAGTPVLILTRRGRDLFRKSSKHFIRKLIMRSFSVHCNQLPNAHQRQVWPLFTEEKGKNRRSCPDA